MVSPLQVPRSRRPEPVCLWLDVEDLVFEQAFPCPDTQDAVEWQKVTRLWLPVTSPVSATHVWLCARPQVSWISFPPTPTLQRQLPAMGAAACRTLKRNPRLAVPQVSAGSVQLVVPLYDGDRQLVGVLSLSKVVLQCFHPWSLAAQQRIVSPLPTHHFIVIRLSRSKKEASRNMYPLLS